MGKLRIPIFVVLLFHLSVLAPSSGFIKAAIGFRLGLSPAEKGYGQPTEVLGLHSKSPIIKGQFLTGVHGQPKSASASESTHAQNSPAIAHSPQSSPAKDPAAGNGLLRHLKILGVNLYLGAPKGQTQGSTEGQGQQGERGQYSHNVQTIDKEGKASGRSMVPELQEIFMPAASQYRQHPNSVESSGPPPSKGFSLASLMRGPGWNVAAGRPSLFRIPLRLPFMSRGHSGARAEPKTKSQIPVGLGSAPSSSQHHYSTLFKSQRPQIMMQMQGSAHPNFNFRPPHQHQQPQMQMMYRVPYQNQGYPQMNTMQASNYPMVPYQGPNSFNQHQRPYFENHQNSRQSENGHFAGQGQSVPMPDDFRPPEGFEFSHTESSPIVSMGTTSYDEPPIMMEDGQGHGQNQGQGQKVNEGPYNLFGYQNQNQRSSQQPSNLYPAHVQPQTQLQAPRRNANAHAQGREEFGGYVAETKMGEMKVISREEFEAAVGAFSKPTQVRNSHQKKLPQSDDKSTSKQRQMVRYMRRRPTTQIPTDEKATGVATQPPTRRTRSKSSSKSSEVV